MLLCFRSTGFLPHNHQETNQPLHKWGDEPHNTAMVLCHPTSIKLFVPNGQRQSWIDLTRANIYDVGYLLWTGTRCMVISL